MPQLKKSATTGKPTRLAKAKAKPVLRKFKRSKRPGERKRTAARKAVKPSAGRQR